MPHVLVGGDTRRLLEWMPLFTKWGITCGRLDSFSLGRGRPTVQECDLVILALDSEFIFQPSPEPGPRSGDNQVSGQAAPVLVVGGGIPALPADHDRPWTFLAEIGPNGSALLKEIHACLKSSDWPQSDVDSLAGTSEYLHFVSHEMRTPLTAIKTALEVLEGELGGLNPSDQDADGEPVAEMSPSLRMLGVALRNVQRLHRTLDWSQENLQCRTTPAAPVPQEISVHDLAEELGQLAPVLSAPDTAESPAFIDPFLVGELTKQMLQVLEYSCPAGPVSIHLRRTGRDADLWQILVSPADGEHEIRAHQVVRAHLVTTRDSALEQQAQEMARLARFVVSDQLLDLCQARIKVSEDAAGSPALVLEFQSFDPQPVS